MREPDRLSEYRDILERSYEGSATHPRMPMGKRAAQFSPFAALVGYDAAVDETARVTDERLELGEDRAEELDFQLRLLEEALEKGTPVPVTLTCFVRDARKAGGSYPTLRTEIRRIDSIGQQLVAEDGGRFDIGDLIDLALDPGDREV